MNLYLIRHSISEKLIPPKKDFERELTSDGIELIKKASEGWKKIISTFDMILYSPYVRAEQTANVIAEVFSVKEKLIRENNIAAGCSTGSLIDVLSVYQGNNIAVVGHQPDLSNHISNLCSNNHLNLSFPPAAIAKISFDGMLNFGRGRLEFLIPAEAY
ncbi:MAG: phosphohistidine phosphatase SixA [Ignavibacterium sp.]|uniref:phosphohistidine phosphatase SixA n=1 Tax=Ignavibacterium sp. TaxID=2651167 RepID=UPI0021DC8049|nr:phosphohistidine phosphatase SixA [Ignavibacterium sp.]BDQ01510.1 MAG: phosphohistidine phosphatase SixA [Ignavibacterium sp.]GIV46357.1 MAG: phosphohistidine phosphatase SixA [Ignavibacterium sp.]